MNLLIGCDYNYYNKWGINCLLSIKKLIPWVNLHTIIVNPPSNFNKLDGVSYYIDNIEFKNERSALSYYQAVRFIKCSEIFPNNELVMTIDCDTLCSKPFSEKDFKKITETIHVQRHQKKDRWMAGLVTYGNSNSFRNELRETLLSIPIEKWKRGRDQAVLRTLAPKYNFNQLLVGDWMSFGRGNGIFLTLKGDQKVAPGYLENYNNTLKEIQ